MRMVSNHRGDITPTSCPHTTNSILVSLLSILRGHAATQKNENTIITASKHTTKSWVFSVVFSLMHDNTVVSRKDSRLQNELFYVFNLTGSNKIIKGLFKTHGLIQFQAKFVLIIFIDCINFFYPLFTFLFLLQFDEIETVLISLLHFHVSKICRNYSEFNPQP